MKYNASTRSTAILRYIFLAVIVVFIDASANGSSAKILSDNELIEWAHDTYLRGDWIYAVAHINALIQRNPPALRNNPRFAEELGQGFAYAVKQLENVQRTAEGCKPTQTSGGVGQVQSGLSSAPPEIHFPKYK